MGNVSLEEIVSLAKRRGFIYQGSEVYGGLAGTWDYGPLGVALKRNIMQLWWKMFVEDADNMYGVDAAILMNKKVWEASGHAETFTDPLVECKNCKSRFRVDKIITDKQDYQRFLNAIEEEWEKDFAALREDVKKLMPTSSIKMINPEVVDYKNTDFEGFQAFVNTLAEEGEVGQEIFRKNQKLILDRNDLNLAHKYLGSITQQYLNDHLKCERCGMVSWDVPKEFNMMFVTHVGPVADESSVTYLRPETAQGIFTNYKNVVDSLYPDIPFGIAQQGKAFRNEISPRDFIFRDRELEQMEVEYFVHPEQWETAFEEWIKRVHEWCDALGLPRESVHELEVPAEDRAHYSKRTVDFEFDFPIGREELLGLAYRTDFDLQNIQRASGKSMEYRPKDGGPAFVPHVIEPSFGVERAIMAVLSAAYTVDEINGEKRTVLKLPAHLAPVKVAVSPLLKNKPELVGKAQEVYKMLKKEFGAVMWDDNGNIGKRYRRQDEIGTPYCVTIDFQTLEDNTVTVRNRDTTVQMRVAVADLLAEIKF